MNKEHKMEEAQVLRKDGLKQFQIAEMLGVTERTVRNYLKNPPTPRKKPEKHSKLDAFKSQIDSIIANDPFYNSVLIYERIKKMGYTGKISILRRYVNMIRKRVVTEAVIRFETEPGRQAQVDWKEYRRRPYQGKSRKEYAFVMVLGYSRKPFVKFTRSMKESVFLACHIEAFEYFGCVPHEILYDNTKTAFICDREGRWYTNRRLLKLANHYGFIPKRCQIYRPQTKGKVERAINYLNGNFWPQVKDEVWELDALTEQARKWSDQICQNTLADFQQTRAERFEQEKPHLQELPAVRFDYRDVCEVMVNRESLITFETNRYSVPPEYIGRLLTLKVDPVENEAEVFDGAKSIRMFKLEEAGSRTKIFTPEDKIAVMKLWEKQQKTRLNRLKNKRSPNKPDVDTRSPGDYDQYANPDEVA